MRPLTGRLREIWAFSLLWAVVGTIAPGAMSVHASEAASGEGQVIEHESDHKKWGTGLFLGGTEVHDKWEPTLGIELTYHFNHTWSGFALIERSDRDKEATLAMLGLGLHPWKELVLVAGVGRKDPGDARENAVRFGVAYEIHLGHNWFMEPLVAVDIIDHEEHEPVLGLYIGKEF